MTNIGGGKISARIIDVSDLPVIRDFLLSLVEPDTEVILMNGTASLAKLVPTSDIPRPKPERVPDLYPQLWVSDDFDDLLPGEYWLTEQS